MIATKPPRLFERAVLACMLLFCVSCGSDDADSSSALPIDAGTSGDDGSGNGSDLPSPQPGDDAGGMPSNDASTTPDADLIPASQDCETACAHVYDTCEETLFLYYDGNAEGRLGGINENGCRYLCESGYFVGQESCVAQAACNREAIEACVAVDIERPDRSGLDPASDWPQSWTKFETQVFALINLHRQIGGLDCGSHGVKPAVGALQKHDGIEMAAREHVLDMAANDFYGHIGSDGSTPGQRMRANGYSGSGTGEIINRTFESWPLKAVAGWVHSDSHCRRMMMPYDFAGVGYSTHPSVGEVATVDFGD